ncbi:MAG: formyltetrahydrofolate deformylase [Bryobacteraceae bacterium]|nr:formyltetrahydrofolate deformylase [Bryobacteraceae bacterium]
MASPTRPRRTATLLIDCPDAKGLVATVSGFLYEHGANILHSDQHRDDEQGLFFMRNEWDLADFALDEPGFAAAFTPIAGRFNMNWRVKYSSKPLKVAMFASKQLHCLSDLLERFSTQDLPGELRVVVSNHDDAGPLTRFHGVRFERIPVAQQDKAEAERRQMEILHEEGVDLVILARYMQVLSGDFVARFPGRIINVHHSFLPAFSGAKPYHAAHQRGVKLIGATSHYVTEVLDDGPIIEQDVVRVSHRDSVAGMVRQGRDVERVVLSRAVRWHLEHRILAYSNKTVIFD